MTYIHIHATAATAKEAVATTCPDCKRRTRMLAFFTPWYGWESTCIRCGREFGDGEWLPLPFNRFCRKENVAAAKSLWRKMPPKSQNHFGNPF